MVRVVVGIGRVFGKRPLPCEMLSFGTKNRKEERLIGLALGEIACKETVGILFVLWLSLLEVNLYGIGIEAYFGISSLIARGLTCFKPIDSAAFGREFRKNKSETGLCVLKKELGRYLLFALFENEASLCVFCALWEINHKRCVLESSLCSRHLHLYAPFLCLRSTSHHCHCQNQQAQASLPSLHKTILLKKKKPL
jgi:hypothetical protein